MQLFAPFLRGAAIISIGGLITKIIGAAYRIPLTNIIGTEGIGVYQTVFPVYAILLTFSSTGAPSALSKIISSTENKKEALKCAAKVFIPAGIAGSFIMALLSQVLAYFQGEPGAYYSYIALSPSIALVSVIACFRGYFQGLKNMRPTAISQITEQSVKLVFGLLLCSAFGSTPEEKGALACLAVTLSEAGAVVYLAFIYGKNKPPISKNSAKFPTKRLILTVIPITLSSITLPAARLYDGFTIINILKNYLPNALSLYGVYTGSVETVIGVPVAVCYGLAVAVLPSVSHLISQGKINKAYDEVGKSLLITLILSFSASIIVFFSADTITSLLFGKFNVGEREITSRLLSSAAFNIVLLSLIQTETGCLIALGKTYCPCATLFTGLLSKIILQPLLLKIVGINIFAPLICDILCYFVAVFFNLVYIIICNNKRRTEDELNDHRDRNTGGRSLPQGL